MEDRLTIRPIPPENLISIFQSRLKTKGTTSGAGRYTSLKTICDHLTELEVKCVVIQEGVQDPDFLAEHATYYANWSATVPKYCERLHFFSLPPCSNDPLDVLDQMGQSQESYLGFVTLRPVSLSPVGATIIKPRSSKGRAFILAVDEFDVHIAGITFKIAGTPFMQQDNAVGACAQASIWMALRTLRRREGRAAFSPAEITHAATRFLVRGRTLPNRDGLVFEQMAEAIRASGYSPHTIPLRDREVPATKESIQLAKRALHPYIESGIPVILITVNDADVGHAVTLIGHGWDNNPGVLNRILKHDIGGWSNAFEIFDASSWTNPLYINNDSAGPYQELNDFDPASCSLSQAILALPFLPCDVYIDGEEAKNASINLLCNALQQIPTNLGVGSSKKEFTLPKLVARTYLLDRSKFRREVVAGDMHDDVKRYYRMKWLPRRVWITEINELNNYVDCPFGKVNRLGEIIIDPASEPEDGAFLSIHLREPLLPQSENVHAIVIDRDAFSGDINSFPVGASSYGPLVRVRM